jgi:hypothetical protein
VGALNHPGVHLPADLRNRFPAPSWPRVVCSNGSGSRNQSGVRPVIAVFRRSAMAYRLTRARLYRTLAGAASALVLCGIAIFAAARHFAV